MAQMIAPYIEVGGRYPDMQTVGKELFPTVRVDRVSIEQYVESLRLRNLLTPPIVESLEKAQKIRKSTKAIVYIAGALTGVDEETKKRYGLVSEYLQNWGEGKFFGYVPHLHGTDPVKHPQVTPEEVRIIDHLWAVVAADLHINFLYPTAHGNAIEEGWSESGLIPAIYLNPKGNKLSRLTLGMDNRLATVEYSQNEEILGGIKPILDELSVWLDTFPTKDPREFYYCSPYMLRNPSLIGAGLDPNHFHPNFSLSQFLVYVTDPNHPRYGQVGEMVSHDWKESGMVGIRFSDGQTTNLTDGYENTPPQVSFWLK